MQEWHNVHGYDGLYQINTDGDVRVVRPGKEPHRLKIGFNKWYYRRPVVLLRNPKNGRYYRVLVCTLMRDTFLGGPREGFVLAHLDENNMNNALYNLKFMTRSESAKRQRGGANRKPVYKIETQSGEVVTIYRSASAAAQAEYCDKSTMQNACCGRYKSSLALGDRYMFMYEDRYEKWERENERRRKSAGAE